MKEGRPKQSGANLMPTFTHTRTITVARVREDDGLGYVTSFAELKTLEWKQHLQRISSREESGIFFVMFKDMKMKEQLMG